jgi:hypothetical protein
MKRKAEKSWGREFDGRICRIYYFRCDVVFIIFVVEKKMKTGEVVGRRKAKGFYFVFCGSRI